MSAISVVITAHKEGLVAGPTIRSMLEAVKAAEDAGHTVKCYAFLDRASEMTRTMFTQVNAIELDVREVDFGDQGLVRNAAIECVSGDFVAFLDADDLWSHNWLPLAHSECESDPRNVIVHPELNIFFEGHESALLKPDMRDPNFSVAGLRMVNYYDALCFAHRSIYERFPYATRDIEHGFAYEDWQWVAETIAGGVLHYVAKGTVHFKRRRLQSQNRAAVARGVIHRPTALSHYSWYET